jgi:hypothetical protein
LSFPDCRPRTAKNRRASEIISEDDKDNDGADLKLFTKGSLVRCNNRHQVI